MEAWELLLEVVILLAGCLLAGAICSALKQNPLTGYLLAGMLLGGPGSFHVVQAESHIEAIAELGVALLLFSLGLEFSWARLLSLGQKTLGAGVVQVIFTGLFTALFVKLLGFRVAEAVAIGAMLSLSSTAAVLRVLLDRGEMDSSHGRNSLAILLVQDVAVVPLAILMSLLAGEGNALEITIQVIEVLGLAAALVLGLYLILAKGVVWGLSHLSVEKNRELTVLLAVVVGLGATWAAHAIGLSPALGAFIAGMFLGSSPFATQVRADVSSLRIVLLTLFFGAVGMIADPLWIAANLPLVLGIAALLVVCKTILVWAILRMVGQPGQVSLASGMCLAQIGEFAFVLGNTGRSSGIVGDEAYMAIVSTAIVTLFATPYLVGYAPAFSRWYWGLWRGVVQQHRDADADDAQDQPDVVIVGFGPAGQSVGQSLLGQKVNVLVLDLSLQSKLYAESLGFRGEIGDASNYEVLHHAGVQHAKVVAITLPGRSAALAVLDTVRNLNPTARMIVRSRYQAHEEDFRRAGADAVSGDEAEVGKQLADHVLTMLDDSSGESRPAI